MPAQALPSALVVDASVAVKWFVPEPDSDSAVRLLVAANEAATRLLAPDLLLLEVAATLARSERGGRLSTAEVDEAASMLHSLPVRSVSVGVLWHAALSCARSTGMSVCDGTYVALAGAVGAPLATADSRLVAGLAGTPYEGVAFLLGEWPGAR